MNAAQSITQSIVKNMTLSLLNKLGATDRAELVEIVTGLSISQLDDMEVMGLVKRAALDSMVIITTAGKKSIGMANKVKSAVRAIAFIPTGYSGIELRPFTGRPGCNMAMGLPSRIMDTLHYRDGRTVAV